MNFQFSIFKFQFKNSDKRTSFRASIPFVAKSQQGYTLIEILISLTILGILFIGGYTAYREYVRRQILQNASQEIKSNLSLARQKALSGERAEACTAVGDNLGGYKVTFTATSYSVAPLCTCITNGCIPNNPSSSYTVLYSLPQSVSISTSGISGSLLYNTVNGTNLSGNATITLTHSAGGSKVLTINQNGVIQ